jgi:hypothetical protein
MTMAIGQGLREAYGVPRSLPKRLLALLKRIKRVKRGGGVK